MPAVSASSAACPIIFVAAAIGYASRRTGRSKYDFFLPPDGRAHPEQRLIARTQVCLFDPKEISLRDELRGGATDSELLHTIGRAVQGKHEKHAGMEDIDTVTNRPMILIGG